jgi:hypothetical protein
MGVVHCMDELSGRFARAIHGRVSIADWTSARLTCRRWACAVGSSERCRSPLRRRGEP